MNNDPDILIVGAGLVGLSLAAALQASGCGLKVKVLDARAEPATVSVGQSKREEYALSSGVAARVSSINPASKNLLERIGAWERIPDEVISPFQQMNVWDGQGTSHIEFGHPEKESLGYIVENYRIEDALIGSLDSSSSIELHWGCRLQELTRSEDGIALTLEDGSIIRPALIVGADGGNSRVRELCDVQTVKWPYQQAALVTTVDTEHVHGHIARQCFTKDGPLAFLPLADEHHCSIVWSVREAQMLMTLTDAEFCNLVGEAFEHRLGKIRAVDQGETESLIDSSAFEHRLGKIRAVDQRFSFPLIQQHAMQYVGEHVALIGDAAHTIHPLAGQGANLGFADARTLSQVLAGAKLEGRSIGDIQLLKQYQRQRITQNVAMAAVMEAFKRLYSTDNPGVNWIRNAGMKMINENDRIKSMIVRLAAGY